VLVEAGRFGEEGEQLARYWLAEGVAGGQGGGVVSVGGEGGDGGEGEEIGGSLPMDLHYRRAAERKERAAEAKGSDALPSLAEVSLREGAGEGAGEDAGEDAGSDYEEEAAHAGDEGLTIAWQYKREVQEERGAARKDARKDAAANPSAGVFCHSFDLSRPMQPDLLALSPPALHPLPPAALASPASLFLALHPLLPQKNEPPLRLYLHAPPPGSPLPAALALLLAHAREHSLPVALLILSRPHLCASPRHLSAACHLRHAADSCVKVDSFAGLREPPPPEYKDYVGLLTVVKVGGVGGYAPPRPAADRYGVKRDRRKMSLKLLSLPPEDHGKGSGGSVRGTGPCNVSLGGAGGGSLDF
jgi:hypothetical protein